MNESDTQQGNRPAAFNEAVRRLERCPKCGAENQFDKQTPTIEVDPHARQAFCTNCSHDWKVSE
jgi:DNA-directed RNA polymerase subunit M/transcription elongation factor TFIIS